jgi:hypothetical protein
MRGHAGGMDLLHAYHVFAETMSGLEIGTDKLIHMNAGLLIWAVAAIGTGRSFRSPLPLLAVALAEAANETADRLTMGSWRIDDTMADVAATLAWPVLLMLALRISRAQRKRRVEGWSLRGAMLHFFTSAAPPQPLPAARPVPPPLASPARLKLAA